ncbi:MAG TPA: OsmC family protein [Candidatus Rubrimentiphilum sp.]|nr:OsmC family protein [Candidatus Rubrimentiphilum sp.]
MTKHHFKTTTRWTGNLGSGTNSYREYSRDHEITSANKISQIPGSSAKAYRGDESRYNPEELLVASLSACHMLWFLHLCADAKIVVTAYEDEAEGTMRANADGSGEFEEVVLHPRVQLADPERSNDATALHERAHAMCFISRSVNFPVKCLPQ